MDDLAIVRQLEPHPDARGAVTETYRASWFPDVPPVVQLTKSVSVAQVVRGMHVHREQWDIWHFVKGYATVRLWKDGVNRYITTGSDMVLAIPPGVAHGFYTYSGCTLLYGLTREYDGTDEDGWYPFDLVGYLDPWPISAAGLVVSDRDLGAARHRRVTFR